MFEPGWSWHEHVKPIAGTDSCEIAHFFYVIAGRMRVAMDDGGEVELRPGDVASIPPGHDAEWSATSRSSWSTSATRTATTRSAADATGYQAKR